MKISGCQLPSKKIIIRRLQQVNTHFTSTDQTLGGGAKADSVVRGTQLFHSKHSAHHFLIKGITSFLRLLHQFHLSFSYVFIYKATDENQTVHKESKKAPEKGRVTIANINLHEIYQVSSSTRTSQQP